MGAVTRSNLDEYYSMLMKKIDESDTEKVEVNYFTHSTNPSVQQKVKVEGVLRGYSTDLPSRSPLAQNLELKGIWVEAHSDLYSKRSPYGTRRITIKTKPLMKYLTTYSCEEIEHNLNEIDKKYESAKIKDNNSSNIEESNDDGDKRGGDDVDASSNYEEGNSEWRKESNASKKMVNDDEKASSGSREKSNDFWEERIEGSESSNGGKESNVGGEESSGYGEDSNDSKEETSDGLVPSTDSGEESSDLPIFISDSREESSGVPVPSSDSGEESSGVPVPSSDSGEESSGVPVPSSDSEEESNDVPVSSSDSEEESSYVGEASSDGSDKSNDSKKESSGWGKVISDDVADSCTSSDDRLENEINQACKIIDDNEIEENTITQEIEDGKLINKLNLKNSIGVKLGRRTRNEAQETLISDVDEISKEKSSSGDHMSKAPYEDKGGAHSHEIQNTVQDIEYDGTPTMANLDGSMSGECGQKLDENVLGLVTQTESKNGKKRQKKKKARPKRTDLSCCSDDLYKFDTTIPLAKRYCREDFLKDEILKEGKRLNQKQQNVQRYLDSHVAEIPYLFLEGAHSFNEKQYARFVLISASHHLVGWCHENLKLLDIYRNPFFQYIIKTRQVLSSACIVSRGKRALFMEILIVGDIILDHLETPPNWDRVKKLRRAGGHPRLGIYVKRK